MDKKPDWKPLDPAGLKQRLQQVRSLIVQAAAVGMTQDTESLERLTELERRLREPANGNPRRYR
jgi:hypothetical protein